MIIKARPFELLMAYRIAYGREQGQLLWISAKTDERIDVIGQTNTAYLRCCDKEEFSQLTAALVARKLSR